MGDRLTVGLQTLTLPIGVRIPIPQPRYTKVFHELWKTFFYSRVPVWFLKGYLGERKGNGQAPGSADSLLSADQGVGQGGLVEQPFLFLLLQGERHPVG